jgi:MoxR-like ATPase
MENMENQEPENREENIHFENRIELEGITNSIDLLRVEIEKVIVGQKKMVDLLLVALFSNGHVLLEGVPGVAKTLMVKTLAKTLGVDFSRIQFTPDLMPSDILGTSFFDLRASEFEFKKGPIFSNCILIDEINRSPAKTQAALFEVMEEKQITIDGTQYDMAYPFMIFATQNPIDQEGTYRLPEAQLDRFMFKLKVEYPSFDEEVMILEQENVQSFSKSDINSVLDAQKIKDLREVVSKVKVEKSILKYIAELVHNTRKHPFLYLGSSPRGGLSLLNSSKAFAVLQGRDFVIPEDVNFLMKYVMRHRIHITPEREMEGMTEDQVIDQIVEATEVPR